MRDIAYDKSNRRFRTRLKTELRVSRNMLRSAVDVVPRFVFQGSSGERIVVLTNLATSGQQRREALRFLSDLLVFHMSTSFVTAYQSLAPDTLTAVLVSVEGCAAATQSVHDRHGSFGEIVFHDPRHTDSDLLTILPSRQSQLSCETVAALVAFMSEHSIAPDTFVLEI